MKYSLISAPQVTAETFTVVTDNRGLFERLLNTNQHKITTEIYSGRKTCSTVFIKGIDADQLGIKIPHIDADLEGVRYHLGGVIPLATDDHEAFECAIDYFEIV